MALPCGNTLVSDLDWVDPWLFDCPSVLGVLVFVDRVCGEVSNGDCHSVKSLRGFVRTLSLGSVELSEFGYGLLVGSNGVGAIDAGEFLKVESPPLLLGDVLLSNDELFALGLSLLLLLLGGALFDEL